MIEKLSLFSGEDVIKTKDPKNVLLPPQVEEWLPVDRDEKLS